MEKCIVCGKEYRTGTQALSRIDNKTEICSDCGTSEAFDQFHSFTALVINAIKKKNKKYFNMLLDKYPALPESVMKSVNDELGIKLFNY